MNIASLASLKLLAIAAVALLLTAALLVGSVYAAITFQEATSPGHTIHKHATPPTSVLEDAHESDTAIHVFDERQNHTLASPLAVDVAYPPVSSCKDRSPSNESPGTIPAGYRVSSHLVHTDRVTDTELVEYTGRVTVDGPVIGVIFRATTLMASDSLVGAPGTAYTTNPSANRGYEVTIPDFMRVGCFAPNVVGFSHQTSGDLDQLRIITDVQPTCSGAMVTTNEDTTSAAFSLQCSDPAAVGGPALSCAVTGQTNPALGTLNITNCGSATYTPNPNANGSDTVTYQATDTYGKTTTATVNITVTPVNDTPSFSAGPNQKVLENGGTQSVAGWATAISPGPANEASQVVDFIVSNDNNGLFSVQPAVSASGTLTYTPVSKGFGSATVTVRIHDDGGTANGGVDTSGAQTIVITVNKDVTLDSDGDGCTNSRELQTAPGSISLGGLRNPNNFWDFFDTPTPPLFVRDKAVSVADINAIKDRFGSFRPGGPPDKATAQSEVLIAPPAPPAYHVAYDRTPGAGTVTGPPDGAISVQDISMVVRQFGHSCL